MAAAHHRENLLFQNVELYRGKNSVLAEDAAAGDLALEVLDGEDVNIYNL